MFVVRMSTGGSGPGAPATGDGGGGQAPRRRLCAASQTLGEARPTQTGNI